MNGSVKGQTVWCNCDPNPKVLTGMFLIRSGYDDSYKSSQGLFREDLWYCKKCHTHITIKTHCEEGEE